MEANDGRDWIAITTERLPTEEAMDWATLPTCGAVVTFAGVVRDHSEGRPDVTSLTYEAYEDQAMVKMGEVAAEARRRWPMIERLALLHRVGELQLTEASV